MSKKTSQDKLESEQGSKPEAETADAATSGYAMRSPALPGWLALVVATVAIAVSIWLWLGRAEIDAGQYVSNDQWEEQQIRFTEVQHRLDTISEQIDLLVERVEELDVDGASARQEIRDELDERIGALEARMDQTLDRLEQIGGQQRAVDQALEQRLYMLETAGLLRLAQDRAELMADFDGARAAYRRASRLLREVDDPRLNRARGMLSRELEALEQVVEPDWQGLSARLAQMADGAAGWPDPDEEPGTAEQGLAAEDDSGWWSGVKESLSNLVRVRPRDELPVSPEQVDAAREQLRLRLLSAELAVARRDTAELSHHAAHARMIVRRWFDVDDPSVGRALEQLHQLGETQAAQVPSLGAALAELNRLLEES